jgi:hypothetical protein
LTGATINHAGEAKELKMNPRRFSVNGQGNLSAANRQHKAIQALSPVLDQINQGFAEAEKRLRALHPIRDVWFSYRSEPTDPCQPDACDHINYCIGVAKYKGEWRLCCGTTHDGYPQLDVAGVEPVTETSRWVRVEVAASLPEWFPEIQERIAKAAEDFVPKAKNALEKMIAGLGQI